MKETMTVRSDGRPAYDIVLSDSFEDLGACVKGLGFSARKLCIVTDSNVERLYLDEVRRRLSPVFSQVKVFVFPAGEEHKNLDTVKQLYTFLIQNQFDRKDLLAALGGGVVGDLCGFAAATYLRGVSFIQIPTTLLAQVDSSIGGKTGVDFDAWKNMVGAFHMPRLVYTNVSTLLTLPEEQYTSGLGEILKHGLIRDRAYYEWLKEHLESVRRREPGVCLPMIRRSDEIKRDVVERDPKEQGERALLNFGHTLGHAIEKLKQFQMLHGHCVAVGALAACRICADRGYMTEEAFQQIKETFRQFGLPVSVSGLDPEEVIQATRHDKKMDAGSIRFILLKDIGDAQIDRQVTDDEMRRGLAEILQGSECHG